MTQNLIPFAMTAQPCRPSPLHLAGLFIGLLAAGGSQANEKSVPDSLAVPVVIAAAASGKAREARMWMTVGERRFAVTLADTEAARAFAARLPMTLDMSELNGNEKKFDLPENLPANPSRPGTIRNGDLMLYGTNTVVVFYLTFDSPYSYTRLGRVDDPDALAQALGRGSVKVEFSRQ
ncbi:hypothetical protein M2282_003920 [Variovorax boronicumulans]|uniref:cyclophilin-like fold protein n=1 Tax=Variovorax boronicumulans TaxID=436515 RepID=UPI00247316EA|nr:cyclophilin-like fold protein [Variovorax boronicumulans]MDH6168756.1 hypothetical protein [Variovorax boronicumulans]